MNRFAYLISQFLHPFPVEIFTFIFLCYTSTDEITDIRIIIASISPGILVLLSALYLKFTVQLSDYNGTIRRERLLLISLGAIYHGVGFFILNYYNGPQLIQGLMFCYALNTGFVWVITKKWKISIHARLTSHRKNVFSRGVQAQNWPFELKSIFGKSEAYYERNSSLLDTLNRRINVSYFINYRWYARARYSECTQISSTSLTN